MLSLAYPVPALSSISPTSVPINSGGTTLTLTGTEFTPSSVVSQNGIALPTTYVSSTSLSAQIPASEETSGGVLTLTVTNPSPGGGQSAAVPFDIVAGTLTISVIDLASGANAAIQISGPSGYSAQVTQSQTLQNLPLGSYTIAASNVHAGTYTYLPVTTSTTVTLSSSTAATVTVDYYNIQPDTTKVLDSVGLASLSVAADQSTLIISGQSTVAQSLNPGDVLVCSPTTAIPLGKVVKVTAVSLSSGWYIVLNSPATLMDAYQQYQLSASEQVDATQITSAGAAVQGVKIFRRPKPLSPATESDDGSDPCANQSTIQTVPVNVAVTDYVNISGTITVCPTISDTLSWTDNVFIASAHSEVDVGETADITTSLTVSVNLPQTEVPLGPTIIIPSPAFGVNPTLNFYAGAEGSASVSLSDEVIQSGTGHVGFDYSNGTFTLINTFTENANSASPPQLTGTADLTAYVRGEFGVDLGFGAIEPYVSIKPYGEATVDTTQIPWWNISYGLTGKVGIHGLAADALDTLEIPSSSPDFQILGPYSLSAPGSYQTTPATITGVGPSPLVGSATAQPVAITGTALSNVTTAVLCASAGGCNSLSPTSVSATQVDLTTLLQPGSWTAMTQEIAGNSNTFSFTVFPPPATTSIQAVQPALPSISNQTQSVTFTGSGFEEEARIVVCFLSICNAAATATVSSDGTTASVTELLDHAGLWTAQLTNPDQSETPQFSFSVAGPLTATIAPTGGTVNSTNFQVQGSGATPSGTVIQQVTTPSGQVQASNLTANQNGVFQAAMFTEPSPGVYTLLLTDKTTGETSSLLSIVISNGVSAQIYPSSGTINITPFTVSGSGATPGGTVLLDVLTPNSNLINETTTATSSGNFSFAPVTPTVTGAYSAVCEDKTTSAQTASITWNVSAGASITASINPLVGVINTTVFTISGSGASGNGGVTAHITNPFGPQLYHAQASNGSFSFQPFYETIAGNYTVYVSDDTTGSQSSIVGWTVNPDTNTQLQTMSASLASWNPVFATGSTTVAVMPLTISGGGNGALTGTISSNQPWLLVDGHASESWTAPESIALNANPTSLSAGTYSATLTITSQNASNHQITVPVTATVRQPLQVVTTSIPDVLGGVPYSSSLAASGGTGAGYKWSLVSGYLPYGLSLDPTSGSLSGTTIAVSSTQNLSFGVEVEDSSGADAVGTISVTYRSGLFVLIYSPSNFQFIVGTAYNAGNSITVPTTGGEGQITLTAVGMPPGLSINSTSGLITGTPTKPGSYSVSFYAQDTVGDKGNATFTLQVTEIPLKITTTSLPSATIGTAYKQFIDAQGGGQAGYVWSVQGNLPSGLQGATLTGCAPCNFEIAGTPTTQGTYNFTVDLTDSLGNSTSQAYSLYTGTAPPQIPAATLPLATIGTSYTYTFAAAGGTAPYTWSFVGSGPDPGLQFSPSGVLSGTPTLPSACYSGPSSSWYGLVPSINFTVKVTDANSETATQQFCMGTFYPTAIVSGVTPADVVADGASHALTISGTNFSQTSEVFVSGGTQVQSQYVDTGHVTISLMPSQNGLFALNAASGGQVTFNDASVQTWIIQPAANLGNQNMGFTISDPVPSVTSVTAVLNNSTSECTVNELCQLVISGSGLVFDTKYQIQNQNITLQRATWPSTNLPWATVTTSSFSLSTAGTYTLIISNPNQPSGATATAQGQFTVSP
jgi:hypothetical protein